MMNLVLKIEKKVTEDWLKKFERLLSSLYLLSGISKEQQMSIHPAEDTAMKFQKQVMNPKQKFMDKIEKI
jgi:hypothetical protein